MLLFIALTLFFLLCCSSTIDEIRIKRLRRAKRNAEKSVAIKSSTLAILSHEIRNPLTGLLSIIRTLQTTALDDTQQKLLHTMNHSSQELLQLLDNTLTQTQLEKQQLEIFNDNFSLNELADTLYTLVNSSAQAKGLLLTMQIEPAVPDIVQGDARKIRQILLNLLLNAVKFTASGIIKLQIITASTHDDDADKHLIIFNVIDSGIGMSAETMQQIFSPFSQGHNIQRQFGGTGIGLSLSRNLAQAMGGNIVLSSQPGIGSTFTLTLPLSTPANKPSAGTLHLHLQLAAVQPHQQQSFIKPLRLLIVDDADIHLIASNCLLASLGHQVTTASSATEAIRLARWQTFDCVFIDFHLPDIDGMNTMRLIRTSHSPNKRQPFIVIVSAWLQQEDIANLLSLGADAVCSKPLDLACVNQILSGLANRQQLPTENFAPALSPHGNSRIS